MVGVKAAHCSTSTLLAALTVSVGSVAVIEAIGTPLRPSWSLARRVIV
jgi:hypothetical protein